MNVLEKEIFNLKKTKIKVYDKLAAKVVDKIPVTPAVKSLKSETAMAIDKILEPNLSKQTCGVCKTSPSLPLTRLSLLPQKYFVDGQTDTHSLNE